MGLVSRVDGWTPRWMGPQTNQLGRRGDDMVGGGGGRRPWGLVGRTLGGSGALATALAVANLGHVSLLPEICVSYLLYQR